mgnify:CR=1 FL=1
MPKTHFPWRSSSDIEKKYSFGFIKCWRFIYMVYYGKINPACLHVVSVSCAGLYRTKALLTGFSLHFVSHKQISWLLTLWFYLSNVKQNTKAYPCSVQTWFCISVLSKPNRDMLDLWNQSNQVTCWDFCMIIFICENIEH